MATLWKLVSSYYYPEVERVKEEVFSLFLSPRLFKSLRSSYSALNKTLVGFNKS